MIRSDPLRRGWFIALHRVITHQERNWFRLILAVDRAGRLGWLVLAAFTTSSKIRLSSWKQRTALRLDRAVRPAFARVLQDVFAQFGLVVARPFQQQSAEVLPRGRLVPADGLG